MSTKRLSEFLNLPETSSYSAPEQLSSASTPETSTGVKNSHGDKTGLRDIAEEDDDVKEFDYFRALNDRSYNMNICVLRKAKFSWNLREPNEKPFLCIDHLDIPRGNSCALAPMYTFFNPLILFPQFSTIHILLAGQLTAVIGRVGSGKSSLVSALLGEMRCTGGLIKWDK